jgi:hypothetical protein
MPGGHPPDYREEYCEKLIEHMSKGYSYESFSAIVGTCRATLYNWEKQFPQFLDAKNQARELCQLWWEQQGNAGLWASGDKESAKLNPSLWIFNMKARFRWKDEDIKSGDEPIEKQAITIEDKKQLLNEAKKELERLEKEISLNESPIKTNG